MDPYQLAQPSCVDPILLHKCPSTIKISCLDHDSSLEVVIQIGYIVRCLDDYPQSKLALFCFPVPHTFIITVHLYVSAEQVEAIVITIGLQMIGAMIKGL